MKNDKENTENVTIETNNDAVLYSVMRSFLKRKCREYNCSSDTIYLQAEFNKISLYRKTKEGSIEFIENEIV